MTRASAEGEKWRIRVSGYGTFDFTGTREQAEEMRIHKARWEGGTAMKWRADLSRESDRLGAQIAEAFDKHKGVPPELLKARRDALDAEAKATGEQP